MSRVGLEGTVHGSKGGKGIRELGSGEEQSRQDMDQTVRKMVRASHGRRKSQRPVGSSCVIARHSCSPKSYGIGNVFI